MGFRRVSVGFLVDGALLASGYLEAMRYSMRNGLMATLFASVIVMLLLVQRHSGFMLAVVLLFLIPWWAYSGYRCLRFPGERKLRITKAIVWLVAVVVIFSVHLVMYRSAQRYSLGVSEKIEAYISRHGQCPAELEDVGISTPAFKAQLGLGSYVCQEQRPFLFYASTYVPFETEYYDFTHHEWRHADD